MEGKRIQGEGGKNQKGKFFRVGGANFTEKAKGDILSRGGLCDDSHVLHRTGGKKEERGNRGKRARGSNEHRGGGNKKEKAREEKNYDSYQGMGTQEKSPSTFYPGEDETPFFIDLSLRKRNNRGIY